MVIKLYKIKALKIFELTMKNNEIMKGFYGKWICKKR